MVDRLQSHATPTGDRDNPENPSPGQACGAELPRVDLATLRRLADAASPGPWRAGSWRGHCRLAHTHGPSVCKYDYELETAAPDDDFFGRYVSGVEPTTIVGSSDDGPMLNRHDAAFIAAARAAVPALCDEVERLRAELAAVEQELVVATKFALLALGGK
jgi:hypothetical protein